MLRRRKELLERISKALEGASFYRESKRGEYGSRVLTVWKSVDTDVEYYWFVIQDVPHKRGEPVKIVSESKVFYNLSDLVEWI